MNRPDRRTRLSVARELVFGLHPENLGIADEDLTNTLQSIRWYLDLVPGDVSKFDSMLKAFLHVHSIANPILFWQAVDAIVKDVILHEGQPVWSNTEKGSSNQEGL